MPRIAREARMWAAAVPGIALAWCYESATRQLVGHTGFPLDDAWIHAQFARNLAKGQGFIYSGPEWVAGSTSPLWTLLIAAGYVIAPAIVPVAKVTGVVLLAVSVRLASTWVSAFEERPWVAWLVGAAAGVIPIVVWGSVSGMEVPLAVVLVMAGLLSSLGPLPRRERMWRLLGIALTAVSVLARPENMAVLLVVVPFVVWEGKGRHERRVRASLCLLIVLAVLSPWVAFNEWTIGRPLPTTFYAKSGPGLVRAFTEGQSEMAWRALGVYGPRALVGFWATLGDQFGPALWLLPVGAAAALWSGRTRRFAAACLLVLIVVPFAMGLVAPQRLKPDNVRYVAQFVAMAGGISAVGFAEGWRFARLRIVTTLVLLLIGASTAQRAYETRRAFAISVKNIEELHVTLARWISVSLPADATLATNDVGAIAYFGGRRVLDIEGLVTPEALEFRGVDRGLRYVEHARPDFVVCFPHWYPQIAADTSRFRLVHRASIPDNVVSAGAEFVVLQTPWARHPLLPD